MKTVILIGLILAGCSGAPESDDTPATPPAEPPTGQAPGTPAPGDPRPGEDPTPPPAQQASCGVSSGATLTGDGVGAFTVGKGAAELLTDCPVATDSTVRDVEGMMQRVIGIRVSGGAVRAMIVDDAIWRVHVTTPSIATRSGISVGTTLAELLEHEGVRGMMGEGRLFVTLPEHCGMSFALDTEPGELSGGGNWTVERLRELPGSTPVDEMLAFGC